MPSPSRPRSRYLPHLTLLLLLIALSGALSLVKERHPLALARAGDVVSLSAPSGALEGSAPSALPIPIPLPTPSPASAKPNAPTAGARADEWGRYGYDISWPQCGKHEPVLPPRRGSTAIVGITGGRPMTSNPCLVKQWAWAKTVAHQSGYINLAYPHEFTNPMAYGARTTRLAIARARSAKMELTGVWLDIESGNHWSRNHTANFAVIRGAIAQLQAEGLQAGIYTTRGDWERITGNAKMAVPLWLAVYYPSHQVKTCSGRGLGGRTPDLVQAVVRHGVNTFDQNYICTKRADFLRVLG